MLALIVEDERLSADRLKSQIQRLAPNLEILDILDSVESAADWFRDNSHPDVLFLDIQLNDGTGFDLLNKLKVNFPIIFTTAYDQYAIKAFKFNGADYLLKPVSDDELKAAIEKVQSMHNVEEHVVEQQYGQIQKIISGDFKKRFLIKIGERFQSIGIADVAFFQYSESMCYVVTTDGKKYPVDYTMDQLEGLVNPLEFFRINRQYFVSLGSIAEIHSYFNSRLLLKLNPDQPSEVIVSRDRVADFKYWMDL